MKVPYINLGLQQANIMKELLNAAERVLGSGQFILGEEVDKFEKSFAELCQTRYSLGVANGTDALILSLKSLGIKEGDEVITAPNSFLASASSIALTGAVPVFADVKEDFNLDPDKVENAITPRTKAIIAVHLTGRPASMDELLEIAKKRGIAVIEDCAQAVGAEYKGKKVGGFGITGCFSLHPLKNLAASGDGGVITTNDEKIYRYLLKARNHGLKNRDECEFWGFNSRLDNLQAALLNIKMRYLDNSTIKRREIAKLYHKELNSLNLILPVEKKYEKSVYHTYIIQTDQRNQLKEYLAGKGIETKIHYPIPIHLQQAAKYLNYKKGDFPITEKQSETILSIPVYPELTNDEVTYIVRTIKEFFKSDNLK